MKEKIYGYYFVVVAEKGEKGWVAYAPGVGGVYEEGATRAEAIANAYEAACAILDIRCERNDSITEENEYLKILTAPPDRNYIEKFRDVPDGYIVTLPCAVSA